MKYNKFAVLYIDSTDNQKTIVGIRGKGKINRIEKTTKIFTSQVLLPAIEELLIRNNLTLPNLQEIKVKTGKGSFTGIRVGITVANILGRLLNIPVNGKINQIAIAQYKRSVIDKAGR